MVVMFWVAFSLLVWHFVGYGMFVGLLALLRPQAMATDEAQEYPTITIIITAHNEEKRIAKRIDNCLAIEYPLDKMEVLVCSDASTDRTVAISRQYEGRTVCVIDSDIHNKTRTREQGIRAARGEIILFTDVDTEYEPLCVKRMVRHYQNPVVGCVGGMLSSESFSEQGIGRAQGLYWKWEHLLRHWQSRIGMLMKTSGANMSIRRAIYRPIADDVDIDQAAGPMTFLQGYRVMDEPRAIAHEEFPTEFKEEFAARRRLTVRAMTALLRYPRLLNPFRHPWAAFHLFSYRVLRYSSPFLLLMLLACSIAVRDRGALYLAATWAQAAFYGTAMIGGLLRWTIGKAWFSDWPLVFCWIYAGVSVGVFEFLFGRRVRSYDPVDSRVDP